MDHKVSTIVEGVMCEVFLDHDRYMVGRATWPDGYQATWRAKEPCDSETAGDTLVAWAPRVIGQLVASRPEAEITV